MWLCGEGVALRCSRPCGRGWRWGSRLGGHGLRSVLPPSGWRGGGRGGRRSDGGGGWGEAEQDEEEGEGQRANRWLGAELHMAGAEVGEGPSDPGTGEQRRGWGLGGRSLPQRGRGLMEE